MEQRLLLNISNGKKYNVEKTQLSESQTKKFYSKNLKIGDTLSPKEVDNLNFLSDDLVLRIRGGSTIGGTPLAQSHVGFNKVSVRRDRGKNFYKKRKKNKNYYTICPKRVSPQTRVLDLTINEKDSSSHQKQ